MHFKFKNPSCFAKKDDTIECNIDDKLLEKYYQEYIVPMINSKINESSGTYNKICTNCLYRNGHNYIWCTQCGQKMVTYSKDTHGQITNREYFLRATNEHEMKKRVSLEIYTLKIPVPKSLTYTGNHFKSYVFEKCLEIYMMQKENK